VILERCGSRVEHRVGSAHDDTAALHASPSEGWVVCACGSQAPALSVVYGGWREDGPEALSRIEDAIESAYRNALMLGMVYSRGWVLSEVLSAGTESWAGVEPKEQVW
jgi:hypothetical protein